MARESGNGSVRTGILAVLLAGDKSEYPGRWFSSTADVLQVAGI